MPPKRRGRGPRSRGKDRGRKGRRKGKKKKKVKTLQNPPPLHLLTELYKKLEEETKMLYEMRIAARKKRIEGWFMAKEMMNAHNDNDRYRDIAEENMAFLKKAMDKLRELLEEEQDSINKANKALLDEYEKKRQEFLRQTELIEDQLTKIKQQLSEFQPMMDELARLLSQLAELEREIEAAQMEVNVKIRHLTSQFLLERSKLYNHLEQQLYDLIKHLRSYVMPMLWKCMQDLSNDNTCARWTLSQIDERYIALSEQRDRLILKRKLLTLEKPYWNIEWSFQKLEEMDLERRRQRRLAREAFKSKMAQTHPSVLWAKKKLRQPEAGKSKTPKEKLKAFVISAPNKPKQETPNLSTQLGRDFNKYLLRKLTAANEAQERHARAHKKEEKRFLKKVLEEAATYKYEYEGEEAGEEEEMQEEEEGEEGDEERQWMERVSLRQRVEGSFADYEDLDEDESHDEGGSQFEDEKSDTEAEVAETKATTAKKILFKH